MVRVTEDDDTLRDAVAVFTGHIVNIVARFPMPKGMPQGKPKGKGQARDNLRRTVGE